LRKVRAILLVAFVGVAAGVAALFVLGRTSRPAVTRTPEASSVEPAAEESRVLSEGFDYEQQVAGRPVFRLQGDRFTTDREGIVALEGVRLVLFREGEPYEVQSRTARFDPETHDAELDGDVRIAGGDGWEIAGGRLDLVDGGRAIVSRGGRVRFQRGVQLAGTARRLRYLVEEQVLELIGEVAVAGREEPGGSRLGLAAEQMTWRGEGSTVVAEGGVELSTGPDRLEAPRLEARLTAGGEGFESALASGGVTGRLERAGEGRFEFAAAEATVAFDPASGAPANVLLSDGREGSPAVVVMRAADGATRRLAAPTVLVDLVDGRPARAAASTGVELRERSPSGGERLATAQRLSASFSDSGELAEAELSDDVRLRDGSWNLEGDVAQIADGGSTARITGRPAHARGERGRLRAPVLSVDREAARLDATGGVRASFRPEESPLAGGDPQSAGQPVDVEAREATFFDAPRRFEFRGAVQAAQGESLLFADRLEGEEESSRAIATGKVRTQWTDRAPAAEGAAPVVTVITAERLDYARQAGEAHYTGGVRVRQSQREIAGEELVVELAEGARARRMRLTGAVTIDDRETGRQVSGEAADYDLEAGEVVVTGDPVTIREQSGTTLRGRRALFDQRSGSARLLSEAP